MLLMNIYIYIYIYIISAVIERRCVYKCSDVPYLPPGGRTPLVSFRTCPRAVGCHRVSTSSSYRSRATEPQPSAAAEVGNIPNIAVMNVDFQGFAGSLEVVAPYGIASSDLGASGGGLHAAVASVIEFETMWSLRLQWRWRRESRSGA